MKFSIFLSFTRLHPPEHYKESVYKEKLRQAMVADKCGYHCIWIPEHHLIHKIQVPNGLLACVQIGHHVSCRVGQAVNLITYRHPLITAGEIAEADHILEGRFSVTLGRGAYQYEFERLGIPFSESKERFEEALAVLEKIWGSDKGVSFDGKYFKFEQAHVWPRPYTQPHPDVWYGAQTNPSVVSAAKRGYNVNNWPLLFPMEVLAETASLFHRAREEFGNPRSKQKFGVMRGTFVAPTREKARKGLEASLANHRMNRGLNQFTQKSDERGYVYPEPVPNEPSFDDMYKNLIVGTPQECLEKVYQYERIGVDELMLWFDYQDPEVAIESMQLFAEEVIKPYGAQTTTKVKISA